MDEEEYNAVKGSINEKLTSIYEYCEILDENLTDDEILHVHHVDYLLAEAELILRKVTNH